MNFFPSLPTRDHSPRFLCSSIFPSYFLSYPFPTFQTLPQRREDANRDAQRTTFLGGHMDSIVKEKEAPFSHSRPQRPLLWHLHSLCISNLLYQPYENPNSSTISSGLSSLGIFLFLFFWVKFDRGLILGRFCSLMTHYLWTSRWGSRWLLTIRMAVFGSRLLMPITALVFEYFIFQFECSLDLFN